MKTRFVSYKSYRKDIFKDIDEAAIERIRDAGKHAAKVMRRNANNESPSRPGGFPARREGKLKKSITHRINRRDLEGYVGSRSAKIHLTEFPHVIKGGYVKARPLVRPSLIESAGEVERILSERYW